MSIPKRKAKNPQNTHGNLWESFHVVDKKFHYCSVIITQDQKKKKNKANNKNYTTTTEKRKQKQSMNFIIYIHLQDKIKPRHLTWLYNCCRRYRKN